MDVLVMIAQFLLSISILVGLHELGHLLAAKMFGMRVEKYSIGFPPKLFGFKYGETEYSLGAIPMGGFVKISGMVDESLDTDKLSSEPQPWEFRAKPAWQRLIVMLGGILVNVVTGIMIFVALVYFNGEQYYTAEEVNKHGVYVNSLGEQLGLRKGDKLVKVNGKPYTRFHEVTSTDVLLGSNSSYTVLRDSGEVTLPIPADFINNLSDRPKGSFVAPGLLFEVGEIKKGSPAEKAGLQPGDKILAVQDTAVHFFQEMPDRLANYKGKTVALKVERKGQPLELKATVDNEGRIGFTPKLLTKTETQHFSFFESIPKGITTGFDVISNQITAFGKMFKRELDPMKSIGGPIEIAQLYGSEWDWSRFWSVTALLSMVLAFMNLLPIPALDGGHVMFLTYEMISGRSPSEKFLENAQKVGMVLLLSLMIFAVGKGVYGLIV